MSGARFGLTTPARLAQEIRKSKFVANAANVASEQEALEFLERSSDPGASHNCWAWRLGQRYRFSDDGEPAGTAGKPILQAIDGQSIDNAMVVVTRWFGGIKLGAGGLMRAYGGCAAQCLRQAAKAELIESVRVEFSMEFASLARLRARLREFGAALEAEEFRENGAVLRLSLPQAKLPELRHFLADLSRGQVELRQLD
jgi:uncharacterized YigZ family protein